MSLRARFSVHPAARLHVADAHVALLNWLYARHEGGTFALRLQDADADPSSRAENAIGDELRWLGIDWDEGPIRQSDRLAVYRQHARQLIERGNAYSCYCSPTDTAADPHCRCSDLSATARDEREARGIRSAVRIRPPARRAMPFQDLVLHVQALQVDGLNNVLLTAEGLPSPALANAVDDHDMAITHVIHSQEQLPSTALHLLLCEALDWQSPQFAHVPAVVQRDGDALRLDTYRDRGYLPLAMVNHLARLCWTPRGKRGLLSPEALAAQFDLRRVSRRSLTPDPEQLDWFNRRCLNQLDPDQITALSQAYLREAYGRTDRAAGTDLTPGQWRRALSASVVSQIGALSEVAALARYAFVDEIEWDDEAKRTLAQPYAGEILEAFITDAPRVSPFTYEQIDAHVSALRWRFKASHGIRSREVMFVLRAAITGHVDGPCLIDACQLLGRQRCVERAREGLEHRRG